MHTFGLVILTFGLLCICQLSSKCQFAKLSLVILFVKLCIRVSRFIVIRLYIVAVLSLRKFLARLTACNAKHQLQMAQLLNTSSKFKDKQIELLKGLQVNYSITNRWSLNSKLYEGYTCLHFAVAKGDLQLINRLLDVDANLLLQECLHGFTPVHIAAHCTLVDSQFGSETEKLDVALVNNLLSAQVKKKNYRNPCCNYGVSYLHIACMVNHTEAVTLFLSNGNSINQTTSLHSNSALDKLTPLHFAVCHSAVETVEILLNYGADIHLQDSQGISSLHLLSLNLLDVHDFVSIGKRALIAPYNSVMKRLQSIAELFLINRKLNVDIGHISNAVWKILRAPYLSFIDESSFSAFHLACMLSNTVAAEYFLEHYGSVNMTVNSDHKLWPGWSPLHFAACCNTETFKLLLQTGADVSIKNAKGKTPLDLCLQRFNPEIVSSVLLAKDELSSIKLSDNQTTLSDLLLASNNIIRFETFLYYLSDINISVSLDSPVWAGHTILHLVIMMNEKIKTWKEFEQMIGFQQVLEAMPEQYNCSVEEEQIYWQRIELCLKKGCSASMKNANGQTALHLAFRLQKPNVVEKLLENCQDNETDSDGVSHFHIACVIGKVDVIKRILDNGVDVNCPLISNFQWYVDMKAVEVKTNSTPLHIAVTFKHSEVVSLLLDEGADVYAKDSSDSTPIHLSKKLNLRSIAQLLLEKTPDLRECLDKDRTSHLQVSVYADNESAVTNLLKNTSSLLPSDKKTLQHLALSSNSEKAYRALLKVSIKPEEMFYEILNMLEPITWPFIRKLKREKWRDPKVPIDSKSKMTLLHFACAKFDIKWAKKLLKKGADVNIKIRGGLFAEHTPLFRLIDQACHAMDVPWNLTNLVELLMKKGADVTILSQGHTPLHRLSYLLYGQDDPEDHPQAFLLPVVDLMLRNQKDYRINPANQEGFTHFHYACARNLVDVVAKFLDHGADINRATHALSSVNAGFTPLHFAAGYRCREVAELLLQRNADVNIKTSDGNTPFHMAVKWDFVDFSFIKALFVRGADVNATNVIDETPLECLLKSEDYTWRQVLFFLIYGCSIKFFNTDLDENGILGSAMAYAQPRDRQAIVKTLIEHSLRETLKKAVDNGFNAILSAATVYLEGGELTVDDYFDVFQRLINIGCDIDQQDEDGITALHGAVRTVNFEAVQALLQLGFNLRLSVCKTPLYPNIVTDQDFLRFYAIITLVVVHVCKMQYVGFDESEWKPIVGLNPIDYLINALDLNGDENCQKELMKMEETKISRSLNVKSFLSELRGPVEYPLLLPHRRNLVDEFFKCSADLRRQFPEFCGLLLFRYKRALARMELWQPAKEAFVLINPYFLPDICMDVILKYLRNDELKVLIEAGKEIFNAQNL